MTTENNFSLDESNFKIKSRAIIGAPEVPTVIRLLVTKRIVKTEKQAMYLTLIFVVACVALAVFFFRKSTTVSPAIVSPSLNSINAK